MAVFMKQGGVVFTNRNADRIYMEFDACELQYIRVAGGGLLDETNQTVLHQQVVFQTVQEKNIGQSIVDELDC